MTTAAGSLRPLLQRLGRMQAAVWRAMRRPGGHPAVRLAMLALLLVFLASFKLPTSANTYGTNVDGGYYASVAVHVRDGQGLKTNVSLLYQGMPHFPHPTSIYPLWPLLWGTVAKAFPLVPTGIWLATACYFLALLFGYRWAASVIPRPIFPRAFPSLNVGHAFVLVLGLNLEFFRYTSQPYTEGLGYAVLFAGLCRFHRLWPNPSVRAGLEMGMWIGLAMLARTQLMLMGMAAFAILGWAVMAVPRLRKRYAIMSVCCAAAASLLIGAHYLHLRSNLDHVGLDALLRFDQVRYTDYLDPFSPVRAEKTLGELLEDRAGGVGVAFGTDNETSYSNQFYTWHFAPVVLLPLAVLAAIAKVRRDKLGGAWRWLCSRRRLEGLFLLALAVGAVASTHMLHRMDGRWYFHRRQALPCLIAFFLSLALLLAWRRWYGRLAGVLLLVSGIVLGIAAVDTVSDTAIRRTEPGDYKPSLVKWLNAQQKRHATVIVAMRQPQIIAHHTPKVGYHWLDHGAKLKDIETMVKRLGVRYVLVSGREAFARSGRFKQNFELVTSKSGTKIYKPTAAFLAEGEERR